jgi:benzil reductase ((S)-benzoin forming)
MANQMLKIEMPNHGVLVNDYFPGVVDTNMQKTLRSSSADIFPYSDEFKGLKKDNKLNNPLQVADSILEIFSQTDDQKFAESEWIYEPHNVLDKS